MSQYSNISSNSSLGENEQFSSFGFLIPVFIVAIGGIPGTLVTIRVFSKRVRTSAAATNLILDALAVFDFLTLLCAIPLAIASARLVITRWNQDTAFAILNAITRLPKHYSNLMLLFIGIERFVCVAWPHKVNAIFTKMLGIIYIIVVVIIATLTLVPMAMVPLTPVPMAMEPRLVRVTKTTGDDIQYLLQLPQTVLDPKLYGVLYQITIFVYFILSVGGVIICNLGLVVLLVRRSRSRRNSANHGTLTPAQAREMRTTKLVMAVTAIFLLCVFPLVVIFPNQSIKGKLTPVKDMLLIMPCSQLLQNISYSIDAVVYYIGNELFRKEVGKLMCRICKKPKVTTVDSMPPATDT